MAKKKYLPRYFKWVEAGKIPYLRAEKTQGGLCSIFPNDKYLELIKPLRGADGYWGSDNDSWFYIGDLARDFTPLRQNILLLMAALNNEL